jgi:hypothetical protein
MEALVKRMEKLELLVDQDLASCPIKMNVVQLYADEMERNRKNYNDAIAFNQKLELDCKNRFDTIDRMLTDILTILTLIVKKVVHNE